MQQGAFYILHTFSILIKTSQQDLQISDQDVENNELYFNRSSLFQRKWSSQGAAFGWSGFISKQKESKCREDHSYTEVKFQTVTRMGFCVRQEKSETGAIEFS